MLVRKMIVYWFKNKFWLGQNKLVIEYFVSLDDVVCYG